MEVVKQVKIVLIFIFAIIISIIAVFNTVQLSDGTATILADNFILAFFGTLTGFSISIIAFLYSNIERIRESLIKQFPDRKTTIEGKISAIFIELRDNTLFIFISLVICVFAILFRDIDFTLLQNPFPFITKVQIVSIIKIALLLLVLYAVKDNFTALFKLIKISRDIAINNQK